MTYCTKYILTKVRSFDLNYMIDKIYQSRDHLTITYSIVILSYKLNQGNCIYTGDRNSFEISSLFVSMWKSRVRKFKIIISMISNFLDFFACKIKKELVFQNSITHSLPWFSIYLPWIKKSDTVKNSHVIKDFCSSSNFKESWSSCSTHQYYNLTNFHQNLMKNEKYLL